MHPGELVVSVATLVGAQAAQGLRGNWKSSIWRIQLVSGFHLGKIWATNLRS